MEAAVVAVDLFELFEPADELVHDTGEADADVGVDEEFVLEEAVETELLVLVPNCLQQSSAVHLKFEYDYRYSC